MNRSMVRFTVTIEEALVNRLRWCAPHERRALARVVTDVAQDYVRCCGYRVPRHPTRVGLPAGRKKGAQWLPLILIGLLPGCGGGGGDSSAAPPAPPAAQPQPASIVLDQNSSAPFSLNVGGVAYLSAEVRDVNGKLLADWLVAWDTGCHEVATVSADGVVKAVAPGKTMVTASVQGLPPATVLVTVVAQQSATISLHGLVTGRRAQNWQGTYDVQLPDSSRYQGVTSLNVPVANVSFPVVTEGCVLSSSCVTLQTILGPNQSSFTTMTGLVLNMNGTATLADFGTVMWSAQLLWVLPGQPAPTVAVLVQASGTLGNQLLIAPSSSFAFNGTLTASFSSLLEGQQLETLRLDFDAEAVPPVLNRYTESETPTSLPKIWIDNGVPVDLQTPLVVVSAPTVPACSLP